MGFPFRVDMNIERSAVQQVLRRKIADAEQQFQWHVTGNPF